MASFVVSKPANSFDALLERAARQLPLNSPVDVTAMRDLLSKIVDNVLQAPLDSKYRTLKLQNKTLRLKLFDKPGAKEVMSVLGFKRITLEDTREAAMFLPFDAEEEDSRKAVASGMSSAKIVASTDDETASTPAATEEGVSTSTSAAALAEAWAWLKKQLDACLLMQGATKPQSTCCAECTLQVRLPTGASFKLAFFAAEPLSAVVDYLNLTCPLQAIESFNDSNTGASSTSEPLGSSGIVSESSGDPPLANASWLLQQPHPPRTVFVDASDLSKSLESHGLLPRANLVAVAPAVDVASSGGGAGSSSSGSGTGSGVLTPAELLKRQAAASGAKMQEAHVASLARQREAEAKMRQNKARAADSLKQERARLVADFAADRSDARERREAKAAASAAAAGAEAAAAEASAAEAAAAAGTTNQSSAPAALNS